jgi:hypothetical protein
VIRYTSRNLSSSSQHLRRRAEPVRRPRGQSSQKARDLWDDPVHFRIFPHAAQNRGGVRMKHPSSLADEEEARPVPEREWSRDRDLERLKLWDFTGEEWTARGGRRGNPLVKA